MSLGGGAGHSSFFPRPAAPLSLSGVPPTPHPSSRRPGRQSSRPSIPLSAFNFCCLAAGAWFSRGTHFVHSLGAAKPRLPGSPRPKGKCLCRGESVLPSEAFRDFPEDSLANQREGPQASPPDRNTEVFQHFLGTYKGGGELKQTP